MIGSIEGAQRSILIEMYVFLDDTKHDFIGKIAQKAKEGVRVIIIADLFGSSELKKESVKKLRDSGVEFFFFNQWLRRTHRKIMIIDGETAFIGGVNIGRNFSLWSDLHLKISNRAIVHSIARSFANTYAAVGGKDHSILKMEKRKISSKLKSLIIHHWPSARKRNRLKNLYVEKISRARKNIIITTPYLAPPFWLARLLRSAVDHGIEVEIIIPKKTNHVLADKINYFLMRRLNRAGIRFLLFPEMNHSKSLLIDDKECLIGSQNLDILSFYLNPELSIISKDKRLVRDFGRIIRGWKKIAVPLRHGSKQ